jgi:aminoglycoside phosphotransferase (APT) family kinase protein
VTADRAPDFDTAALGAYLARHIDGLRAPIEATRFAGGQSNPTDLLTDAQGWRFVLRRKPGGALLASAHAIDREYRVARALAGSAVPVPRMHCYCDDPSVIGTAFYVMAHVDGRIFWDPSLPELPPAERAALYADVNRVVAGLHRLDVRAVGLEDFGRPGNYFERQIARWTRQYRAAETEPIAAMERLIAWLPAHVPATGPATLVHGDLRIDNMIMHPTEPRVVALIDWELSTLGHPLADFAYHLLPWRLTSEQFRGMAEKSPLPEGVPSEASYVARYDAAMGTATDPQALEFAIAHAMFRMAAILQGIHRRARDGNAASAEGLAVGARARRIADAAWAQVQQHFADAR